MIRHPLFRTLLLLLIVSGFAACGSQEEGRSAADEEAAVAEEPAMEEESADPAGTETAMEEPSADAVIAAQLEAYPMTTCPISGKTLGAMGEPYNHVANGRLVRFCCDGCIPEFEETTEEAMAKVDAAYVAAGIPVPAGS